MEVVEVVGADMTMTKPSHEVEVDVTGKCILGGGLGAIIIHTTHLQSI